MSPVAMQSPASRPRRLPVPTWLVVAVWLGCTGYAFWFFQVRYQREFEVPAVSFFDADGHSREAEAWFRTLDPVASTGTAAHPVATVVNVSREGCACNRFTDSHVQQMTAQYRGRGVSFVRAPANLPAWIRSTPAALVFDRDGRLIYFGPYSDTAFCGASGGRVERTLDQVLKGNTPRPQRAYARGCFCEDG